MYVKYAGVQWICLRSNNGGRFGENAMFDVLNGTVGNFQSSWSNVFCTPVGNGWFRIGGTYTPTHSDIVAVFLADFNAGNTNVSGLNFVGDGFKGVYIWGLQTEQGASFPTSYIPTVASQVTRSADSASMTGTNFSSWYKQGEGTLFVTDTMFNTASKFTTVAGLMGGTANNNRRILLFRNWAGAFDQFEMYNSGNQVSFSVPRSVGIEHKVAVAYQTNNTALSFDGQTALTDTVCTIPVVDRLEFGSNLATSFSTSYVGTIKKLAYYPARLTDAQLQALTS